ncbi:endonuclease [Nonlabens ulvanivorans]|uniref:endonuclease n=1 Tax=Nonlabens ulvanivorans TaxID=906888 RepID=UPI0037CC5A06
MKNFVFFILFISFTALGQIPTGYYNTANGLTGYPLKTELKNIITAGHNPQSYDALYTLYATSDNDDYYDNGTQTNTILDIYSENPAGADSYNFGLTQDCSGVSITQEGLCYNREHIFPQGFFNSSANPTPRHDAHHVIPTDGFVNNGRANYPFGEVGTAQTTYANGSKWGNSISPGYTDRVFEPIDEFKGDVARMMLYFATRYEDNYNDSSWDNPNASNYDPRDGSQNRWYEQWFIDQMLIWHAQDPVSPREVERNNEIYNFQGNRNPYIDNPQYVAMIWSGTGGSGSGTLFPTLSGTYVDINGNSIVDAGDEIQYTYDIANIGTTTLYNLRATSPLGTFNPGNQVASLAAGQSLSNPFGTFTYILTAADATNSCGCITNQLLLAADYNATGTNGTLNVASDDPNNFTNNDSDGDNLPDDFTIVTYPNGGSGVAGDLFISEYIEGSGNNKAIEIANFTGASVDLSNYTLQISTNGSGSWASPRALMGTLADQDVYVVTNSQASDSNIIAQSDEAVSSAPMNFNGNDAVGLFRAGVLLDVVGDPNSSADSEKDQTLVRKASVTGPNTVFDKVGEWDVFTQDTSSDLGTHTYGSTASLEDNAFINLTIYPNPSSGVFHFNNDELIEDVTVYDVSGRRIKSNYSNNDGLIINHTGIYFVNVMSQGQSKTFKVIVR